MEEQERPLAAFLLSLIGGVLILIDGALLGVAGGVADALGNYAAGALLGNLGFLGGFLGFLVLLLGVGAFLAPQYHTGLGIGILVLSLLSIFGGGGFVIGLLLGMIGGILAIVFRYEEDDAPLPSTEYLRRARPVPLDPAPFPAHTRVDPATGPAGPPSPTTAPPTASGEERTKSCSRCSAKFEAFRIFCPQCGAPAPPSA